MESSELQKSFCIAAADIQYLAEDIFKRGQIWAEQMKTLESYVFRAEYIAREIWQIQWMEKLVFSTDFSMLMVQLLFQKLSIFCRKSG